jgi:hypothetical protein
MGFLRQIFSVLMIGFSCFAEAGKIDTLMESRAKPVNENLTTAVYSIIGNIFMKRHVTTNLLTAVKNPKDPNFLDIEKSLLQKYRGFDVVRLESHTSIKPLNRRVRSYITILLDSYDTFLELNEKIQPNAFNFQGLYLFVLINGKLEEIDKMFNHLWSKKIVNVNAIYEEESVVKLATFRPFQRKKCQNSDPIVFAVFNSDGKFNISIDQIYPDELKNFHGCELKMAVFDRCPAVCMKTSLDVLNGFDGKIVTTIQEALNFELNLDYLVGSEQWGNILPNGSVTGAIGKVSRSECDFTAGNFLLRSSRANIMDSSDVYLSFPVVFAIPLGQKLTPFEKLLRPFELIVWIFMLVFIMIGLLVILIVEWKFKNQRNFIYGTGLRAPVVNMTVAILGGSLVKLPGRNFARFLLMMFLIFCFVQRNIYQGLLYIFLQTEGRHKEVQSLKEMIDKNFDFYMFESYTDIIEKQKKIYEKLVISLSQNI